jgi:hypothetical protein
MKKKMGNSCLMMVLSVEEKENRSELPMRKLRLCANRDSSGNSQDIPPYSCEGFSDHACESPFCYAKGLYFYQEESIISRPKMSMIIQGEQRLQRNSTTRNNLYSFIKTGF